MQFIDPLWVGLDNGLQSQSDLPHRGGRSLRVSPAPQSFGALPLRLGATMRPTASGRFLSVKVTDLGAVETLVDLSPMLSALGGNLYGLLYYLCTID